MKCMLMNTFAHNAFKSLQCAERSSKIISPNVSSIDHSSKKVFATGKSALDQVNSLSSTDQIKSVCSDATQRCEGPVCLSRDVSKVGLNKNIQTREIRCKFCVCLSKCLQLVRVKVQDKGRLIKLNPCSTCCLKISNNFPVFLVISKLETWQEYNHTEQRIVAIYKLKFLLVDSKDLGEKREERKGLLDALGGLGEQQVWYWANEDRNGFYSKLQERK